MNALRSIIVDAVQPHTRKEPYALIDYPNYLNPGDCAIWLGTRKLLEELCGGPPAYVSSLRNFSKRECLRRVPSGTIYFKGGGNLGAIYSKHDRMRRRILESLHGRKIVILPQSMADVPDGTKQAATGTLDYLRRHPDMLVFARDEVSKSAIEDRIGREVPLCPDLCHLLSFEQAAGGSGTTFLLRRDPEVKRHTSEPEEQLPASWDWGDIPSLKIWNRLGRLPSSIPNGFGRLKVQDAVAAAKVEHAIKRLAKHELVVTDRLHGVLLSSAIGLPVISLDNSTGKIAGYYKTWGTSLPRVSFSTSMQDALQSARKRFDNQVVCAKR
ncbi:polysaccharide pyruvyl transferase family protein [Oricola sp.]|uniref:polysaccharide pyruvyl transferase family protein n=1 Tax=Oricola sp. TaxID=1979950 RepID=UPI003BACBE50